MSYQHDLFIPAPPDLENIPLGLSSPPIAQQKKDATIAGGEDEVCYFPYLQIRPNYSIIYYKPSHYVRPRASFLANQFKRGSNHNRYQGQLTKKSISKMRKAIELLVAVSREQVTEDRREWRTVKHRITFVTLTLASSQGEVSDKAIKSELLNHFIISAKRKWGMNHYVWKAERQDNGNIHFHITTDVYIPYRELRNEWNRIQEKLGYVSEYRSKFSSMSYEQFKVYSNRNGEIPSQVIKRRYRDGCQANWTNPNSTDVHAVRSISNLAAYMVKYMVKQSKEGEFIDGKVWDCSMSLKRKVKCEFLVSGEIDKILIRVKQRKEAAIRKLERIAIIDKCPEVDEEFSHLAIKMRWKAYLKIIRSTEKIHNANRHDKAKSQGNQALQRNIAKTRGEIDKIRAVAAGRYGGGTSRLEFLQCYGSGVARSQEVFSGIT